MSPQGSPPPVLQAPAREWVAYDMDVRRERYWRDEPPQDPALAPALALCHRNGRVREAALRGGVAPELLPLVVVRCADWAGPVRDVAREVLAVCDAGELTAVAHVVLRLAGRRHGGYALELLEARLDGEALVREDALRHPAREVRRWAWRRADERWGLPLERFAEGALGDSDVLVQVRCAEAAVRTAPVPPDLLDRLLTARGSRVRAVAVTALRRQGEPGRARGWLTDRSAQVRACAQWAVRQAGGDPLAHYREVLRRHAVSPGPVAGLGECGGPEDVPTVTACLDDPRPAVRGAAVGALRALGAVSVARVLPLLDDPSPGVVRRAVEALLPEAGMLPEAELVARAAPGRPPRGRWHALRLLAARGGLEPLRVALRQVDDPETGRMARAVVQRWTPRDAGALVAALPPPERAALSAEIARAEPVLTPYRVRYLRWITGLRDA
ncbi:HEAT repeat domain-containing protein [Streptomyces sp. NPDC048172]|uniref:HEAT repeat domain-containing protein n=1 Tax=Streptomyces sp. NPDC048172 TaxID=3365505 RepID=UPI003712E95A